MFLQTCSVCGQQCYSCAWNHLNRYNGTYTCAEHNANGSPRWCGFQGCPCRQNTNFCAFKAMGMSGNDAYRLAMAGETANNVRAQAAARRSQAVETETRSRIESLDRDISQAQTRANEARRRLAEMED